MSALVYWDSDPFLGWLQEEPDKVTACAGVVSDAENGQTIIVTSALTIAEVLYFLQSLCARTACNRHTTTFETIAPQDREAPGLARAAFLSPPIFRAASSILAVALRIRQLSPDPIEQCSLV